MSAHVQSSLGMIFLLTYQLTISSVHAHACGAFGEFEVTHDISDITSADFLNGIGKKTRCMTRISTVGPERGAADPVRDVRGFAIKFYTDEGNNDWVFNNIPTFFVRDPIKFPSMNRSHKRNPQTNLPDPTMFWDFHVNNQEGIHALMHLLSDRGIPASVRHLHGFSGSTYKFTKKDGSFKYVKIHFKTNQGIKNFTRQEAADMVSKDPDHHTRDLFEAIERGNHPSWNVYAQIMDPKDAENYRWNIFDMTRVWPHKDYPLRPIGKMTLNENPKNFFEDIEQAAFSPSTMVPGIAPSADPMLQTRMFAYPDAARYRVGPNYQQLPCNAARSKVYQPYQRDGFMSHKGNYGGDPNYVNSSVVPVQTKDVPEEDRAHDTWAGTVTAFSSTVTGDDFIQPRMFWQHTLANQPGQQDNFVGNAAAFISGVKFEDIRKSAYEMFSRVDLHLGQRIQKKVEETIGHP
ncbi:putative catalase [Aspergillus unguis]